MAEVKFYIAGGPGSGLEIPTASGASPDTYRYIGFFASGTEPWDPVEVGNSQGLTWLTDEDGNVDTGLAGSGKMTNNLWVDASGVSIDGASRINLSTVNSSGDATIMIQVSGASGFYVHNPRLYAFDGASIDNDPSGVWVLSYEIIPLGGSGTGDTEWVLTDSTNYNQFVDRASGVGYTSGNPDTIHQFNVGLAIRPKPTSSSGLQTIGLYFDCEVTHIPL